MALRIMSTVISIICFFFFTKSFGEPTILPGQPTHVSFKQYSGYIVTDAAHGRALFYYFVEADSAHPLSRPLTLWLSGGPGCSSLGEGAFTENGPFQSKDSGHLAKNIYSWNLESNMLYVESPIGVGFSYSNTSLDYISWNDTTTAEDNLKFLLNWLEKFPKYKHSDLYLAGDSYAGHYVPQLASLLLEYNRKPDIRPIKLKGVALGSPLLNLDISMESADDLWSHGAISDETLMLEKTICKIPTYYKELFVYKNLSKECIDVFDRINGEIGDDLDRNDLLSFKCLPSSRAEQFRARATNPMAKGTSAADPCLSDRVLAYLNRPKVQKALHAIPVNWSFCSGPLQYQMDNVDINIIPVVSDLLKSNISIMLYNGDQDAKVSLSQTRIIANTIAKSLKLVPLTSYGPWYDNKQVGGWAQSFGKLRYGKNVTYLTFATVRGGSHGAPYTSPSQALTLFRAFLSASSLPTPKVA
ncbi:PREDICTED: serine carboxypeptidase-like 45 isoform X3 [Nelumbo nucifera]|uniref:Serine carboxypeptidase-like 45 isoform X3 n=1 Tax=Nelumbo nucifera TaxID=4432 RepID=A0A1U8Q3T2_NELNU|nr:PREDICTED: serine carboxypeptidase-like 45 isoform X3 [Nelumbo nucifera]